jgi:D-glycero-D-manno-heptose 1,7-bisphosphate phosphatase
VKQRAIFLDRDGTLNRDVPYAHRIEDLQLLDNVTAGLARMAAMGFELVIVTNQSGIARGYYSEDDMHAFHHALCERLASERIGIAGIYYCPFHPSEGIGPYRRASPLRKPRPGMILQAAARHDLDLSASFTIGDNESDILAGQAAGCRTILVRDGNDAAPNAELQARPDFVAADLIEAARFIEQTRPPASEVPAAGKYSYLAGQGHQDQRRGFVI